MFAAALRANASVNRGTEPLFLPNLTNGTTQNQFLLSNHYGIAKPEVAIWNPDLQRALGQEYLIMGMIS
ncbi:MAG: hypothetical protein WBZ11_14660, partial [Candidatus Sulfotelmatobacter sp.]